MAPKDLHELHTLSQYRLVEELAGSEERYRDLVENLRNVVFGCDGSGTLRFLNRAWTEVLDLPVEASLGRTLCEFLHEPDRPKVRAALAVAAEEHRDEVRLVHRDGSVLWFELSIRKNDGGDCTGLLYPISQRKEAEQAAARANQNLRFILDESPFGVVVVGLDCRIRWANRYAAKLAGLEDARAMRGERCEAFLCPRDQRGCPFLDAEPGKDVVAMERILRHRDGREIPILKAVVRGEMEGEPVLLESFVDMSDRKRAAEALQRSEKTLSTVTRAARDAIVMMDEAGRVCFWNPAAEVLFGHREDEALGRDVHELLAPERFRKALLGALPLFRRTGQGRVMGKTTELWALRKGGEEIPVELSLSAVWRDGAWHAVALIRDIAGRKRAEERLQQTLAESDRVNRLMMGREARVCALKAQVNELALALGRGPLYGGGSDDRDGDGAGGGPDEPPGACAGPVRGAKPACGLSAVDARPEEAVGAARPRERRRFHDRRAETDSARKIALSLAEDASEAKDRAQATSEKLKVYAEELERKNVELDRARREAESATRTQSAFLSNMSHEIRTPLNAVLGFSELLEDLVTDGTQRQYLSTIRAAGKTLLDLINDILLLSRTEAGRLDVLPEPVSPAAVFEEIRQIFRQKTAEKGLEFLVDVDPALPELLMLDGTRLRQILFNLVGNAVKFTEQGHVRLAVGRVDAAGEADRIDLRVAVEDTGIGFSEDQKDAVFEPFRQLDGQVERKYGGSGLGLAITKRLAELMNGKVSAASRKGVGSVFELTLRGVPVHRPGGVPPPRDAAGGDGEACRFEKGRVLVADDVESNRALLRAALCRAGLDVLEAGDGRQALELARTAFPDLVLMDVWMPVMDGIEASRTLKEDPVTRRIPVVALSASVEMAAETRLAQGGFDGFLLKPVDRRDLLGLLRRFFRASEGTASIPAPEEHGAAAAPGPGGVADLPGLLQAVREEVLPAWEALRGVLETEAAERLAARLLALAESHNAVALMEYARLLRQKTEGFELSAVTRMLRELPGILERLEGAAPPGPRAASAPGGRSPAG